MAADGLSVAADKSQMAMKRFKSHYDVLQGSEGGVGLEHLADGDQTLHLPTGADHVVSDAAKGRGGGVVSGY